MVKLVALTALLLLSAVQTRAETISFDCAVSNGEITADSGNGCEFNDGSVSFSFSFPG